MSRLQYVATVSRIRFPRVSGDEPPAIYVDWQALSFSPRERG